MIQGKRACRNNGMRIKQTIELVGKKGERAEIDLSTE
jgi:hypothetical protein